MELAEWLKLGAQAGGPTIVACLALWIMHKRDQQTVDIMSQQHEMAKLILGVQTDSTEALTRLTTIIDGQGDVQKQVRDLLVRINGRAV